MEDEIMLRLLEYVELEDLYFTDLVVQIDPLNGECSTIEPLPPRIADCDDTDHDRVWMSLQEAEMHRSQQDDDSDSILMKRAHEEYLEEEGEEEEKCCTYKEMKLSSSGTTCPPPVVTTRVASVAREKQPQPPHLQSPQLQSQQLQSPQQHTASALLSRPDSSSTTIPSSEPPAPSPCSRREESQLSHLASPPSPSTSSPGCPAPQITPSSESTRPQQQPFLPPPPPAGRQLPPHEQQQQQQQFGSSSPHPQSTCNSPSSRPSVYIPAASSTTTTSSSAYRHAPPCSGHGSGSGRVTDSSRSSSSVLPAPSSSPSPLHSPLLTKPECWPCNAASRGQILLPPSPPSFSSSSCCRVLYLPLGSYRAADNLALEMALWFSQHLKIPLDVLAFVEEQQYRDCRRFSDANNVCSSPLAAVRKVVARFSALLGFRDSLQDNWQHPMVVCSHSASRPMAQGLRDIYGQSQRKQVGQGQQGCVSEERVTPMTTPSPVSSAGTCTDLLVVVDDQFHPALASALLELQRALSGDQATAAGGAGGGGGGGVNIRYMVAFDSVNIVPYRSLIPKLQDVDRQTAKNIVKTTFTGMWNMHGSSATTLKTILQHQKAAGLTSFPQERVSYEDEDMSSADSTLSWEEIESTVSDLCCHLQAKSAQMGLHISVPRYQEKQAEQTLQQVLATPPTSVPNDTTCCNEKLLLDMMLSWNVISPWRIISACQRYPLWKERFHASLLHIDLCRHMFLYSQLHSRSMHQSTASASALTPVALALSAPPQPVPLSVPLSYTVDLLELLSPPAIHCLQQLCQESHLSSSADQALSAKEVISGRTSDHLFNNMQQSLRTAGHLPTREMSHHWILTFLRCAHVDVASLLRIVLLEIVRNCVHMLEYSAWPLSYLLDLVEEVCVRINAAALQRDKSSLPLYQQQSGAGVEAEDARAGAEVQTQMQERVSVRSLVSHLLCRSAGVRTELN